MGVSFLVSTQIDKSKTTDIIMTRESVFKVFDADGSGSISASEFKATLEKFGGAGKADEYLKKADTDGSGEIDAKEFAVLAEHACVAAFKKIDADGSGNVSPAEIKSACKGVDASEFVKAADKDGDGEGRLAEFKAALASNAKFMSVMMNL